MENNRGRIRILFVAMQDSVHTARYISQIANKGWEIYLFPVNLAKLHRDLQNKHQKVGYIWWAVIFILINQLMSEMNWDSSLFDNSKLLALVIKCLKPDIIHSLEIQHAGYLTYAARELFKKPFPCWIVTNWGSDIYLFARLGEHRKIIMEILALCDFYSCECSRDIQLAYDLGFKGKTLPVFPNSGGFSFRKIDKLNNEKQPSLRKKILLKGYQHWAGRALFGLQSLRYCTDLLQGYTIMISVSSLEVRIAAELFSQDTGVPIEIIPEVSHDEMLQYYNQSRIYIGLSISDGISTSLLEAMVMGAFPIQSHTSCANEWIEDGQSGFLVPPEDPHVISQRIRTALKDDSLVDLAAEKNYETAQKRLDYSSIQQKVIGMYTNIYNEIKEKS